MWKREMPYGNLYHSQQGSYKEMKTPSGSMVATPDGKLVSVYNVPGQSSNNWRKTI